MHLVFDLDGTLICTETEVLRPGTVELLQRLNDEGYTISLWTASVEERAVRILGQHGIRSFFSQLICRDDYDPNGEGLGKDIRFLNADVLVDDCEFQIEFVEGFGRRGILVPSYSRGNGDSWDRIEERELLRPVFNAT
jgi:phosphoglycolate phosphatase-like HAD superfamily hydrolase